VAAPEIPRLRPRAEAGTTSPCVAAGRTSAAATSACDAEADEVLVARLRAGDELAFDRIYARYFQRVYQYLHRRLRNRADAEETTQEVFVNVFSSIDGYRGEAPFGAWVFGLTRRTLANRFKRKRHTTVALNEGGVEKIDLLLTTVRREPDPLESYEAAERLERLADSIRRELTREQIQLFELHHLRHHSIHEIARSLNKSVDSVKSNLYRARKVLMAR
jgi:RNA polymerase sigma-70 factor (ECF subfamily)